MRSVAILAILFVATLPRAARADAASCVAAAEKGQKERDDGHLVRARAEFEICGREDCPSTVRADCVQWFSEVGKRIPSVVPAATVNGSDARDVKVTIDGKSVVLTDGRSVELDPGVHHLRYEHAAAAVDETVVLGEGEKDRVVRAAFGSAPPPPRKLSLAYAMTATALGSAAVWGVLGIIGLVTIQNCTGDASQCRPNVDEVQTRVLTEFVFGDIGLGAAIVTGAIATWLFSKHPAHKPAPVAFGPAGLSVTF